MSPEIRRQNPPVLGPEVAPPVAVPARSPFVGGKIAAYAVALGIAISGEQAAVNAPVARGEDPPVLPTGPTGPSEPTGPTVPVVVGSSNPNSCYVNPLQRRTDPCDTERDPATLTNVEVESCQGSAAGPVVDKAGRIGMINTRKVRYNLGSRKVGVTEEIGRLERWSLNEFDHSCSSITRNSIEQRMTSRTKNSEGAVIYKPFGKTKKVMGSETTAFDPTHAGPGGGTIIRKTTLLLKKALTKADVRKKKVCIKETAISDPLIQRPYIDPWNRPGASVPGPMKRVKNSVVNCVRWADVANRKKAKKFK